MPPKSKAPSESEEPDWRTKQIVQDIEDHNTDPRVVTVELLRFWNKYVYGDKQNSKDETTGKYWSNKIQVSYGARLPS